MSGPAFGVDHHFLMLNFLGFVLSQEFFMFGTSFP